MKSINVLMIANSFGVNMQHYVHQISSTTETTINIGVLYIGGCSLKTHSENIEGNNKAYDYYENGSLMIEKVSILDALLFMEWDYISLQQFSGESGMYDTYFPYLDNVISYSKKYCPKAKFIFHETWAYKKDSPHPWFPKYNNDPKYMTEQIVNVYKKLYKQYGFEVIPSGEIVYHFETTSNIDLYQPDYLHLNDVGEYVIGVIMVDMLCGKRNKSIFVPECLNIDMCTLLEKETLDELNRRNK